MKPERTFSVDRQLAQHCPELLRATAPAPADLAPSLGRLGDRLARALADSLSPLSGGVAPAVHCGPARECAMLELAGEIAPLAANSLHAAGPQGAPFLTSLDATGVFRLVDRAFGGRGYAPSPLPPAFSLSAELMIGRLEGIVNAAAARAFDLTGDDTVRATRRDGSLRHLAAFPSTTRLTVVTLEIAGEGQQPWTATLAFPQETLVALLGNERAPMQRNATRAQPNPSDEPFGDVPLTMSAVLVDMQIPFTTLSALQVGQVLPVAVARSVPLKVGDKTIAQGTIGAMDDQVAVQITQAF
jgi:flagellar motor switch protein FliM